MRILILGASGFIGSHLTRYAAERGHDVVALCRSGKLSGVGVVAQAWQLGKPLAPATLETIDCAILLAHDFEGEAGAQRTRAGTLAAIAQLRGAKVGRSLYFSSYSAGVHAESIYGRTKFAIEQALASERGVLLIRPGLVLGDAGIYGRIRTWARRFPVVPLPDGGRGQVPVITIERLCRETLDLTEALDPGREANIFEPRLKSLRQLVLEAAAEVGRRPWILPVPTPALMFALGLAQRLRIRLPVNADNLAGFSANQGAGHRSTLSDI